MLMSMYESGLVSLVLNTCCFYSTYLCVCVDIIDVLLYLEYILACVDITDFWGALSVQRSLCTAARFYRRKGDWIL